MDISNLEKNGVMTVLCSLGGRGTIEEIIEKIKLDPIAEDLIDFAEKYIEDILHSLQNDERVFKAGNFYVIPES